MTESRLSKGIRSDEDKRGVQSETEGIEASNGV